MKRILYQDTGYCNVENQTNGPGFSSFKPHAVCGIGAEMKNSANPGLA